MIKIELKKLDIKFVFVCSLLILLFFSTRFINISSNPPSLYWDEASIGYNAYSITRDFRDEWGKLLPIHFRAFGEFKLPVYIYSVSIFIKLFGLNEFSVRAPAVVFSFFSIFFVELIIYELTKNKWLSLLSSFFLITSPWLFIFSRAGYEATAGSMFFVLSFYLFLVSFKKPFLFFFSVLSLVFTLYSYNSFRVISPIVFLIYLFVFFTRNSGNKKVKLGCIIASLFIFFVSLLPIYKLVTKDAGSARFLEVKAASYQQVVSNYLSHFSTKFLLFNGDTNPRSQMQGFGELWVFDFVFILCGIFLVFLKKNSKYGLVLLMLLVSFVPAALTKESPHALRSLSAVYLYSILWIFGLWLLFEKFGRRAWLILSLVLVVNFVLFINYFANFMNNYSRTYSQDWQFGYKQIFKNYDQDIKTYKKIIISDQYAQPYIFALYYQKVDPKEFLTTRELAPVNNWGFSTVKSFGKYEFKKISTSDYQKGELIFSVPGETQPNIKPDSEVKFLDGTTAFYVYKL